MALKIRLTRLGDKGNPFYRIVVAESRDPRDGKFIQTLGTYDPHADTPASGLKVDRGIALEWLAKGATPTDTVRELFEKAKILEKQNKKPPVKTAKQKTKKEKK